MYRETTLDNRIPEIDLLSTNDLVAFHVPEAVHYATTISASTLFCGLQSLCDSISLFEEDVSQILTPMMAPTDFFRHIKDYYTKDEGV